MSPISQALPIPNTKTQNKLFLGSCALFPVGKFSANSNKIV